MKTLFIKGSPYFSYFRTNLLNFQNILYALSLFISNSVKIRHLLMNRVLNLYNEVLVESHALSFETS